MNTKLILSPVNSLFFVPSEVVVDNVFTDVEVNLITNYCSKNLNLDKGELFESNQDYSTREAITGFIEYPTPDTQWLYDKLHKVIEFHNDQFFQFELTGLPYIQYAEYHVGGHHDFHMDTALGNRSRLDYRINENLRKLTVVVMLTQVNVDFTGGEFFINCSTERTASFINLQKGTVLIFPSFLLHKVAPVISGVRKTLTTWVIGPKFK